MFLSWSNWQGWKRFLEAFINNTFQGCLMLKSFHTNNRQNVDIAVTFESAGQCFCTPRFAPKENTSIGASIQDISSVIWNPKDWVKRLIWNLKSGRDATRFISCRPVPVFFWFDPVSVVQPWSTAGAPRPSTADRRLESRHGSRQSSPCRHVRACSTLIIWRTNHPRADGFLHKSEQRSDGFQRAAPNL